MRKDNRTTRTYAMYEGNEKTAEYKGTTPSAALRGFFGDRLASSKGRYGRLNDGRPCAALLTDTSRVRYKDHGTTRPLR